MPEQYMEKEKSIPISGKVDILVVGGGAAGVPAAIAAAEQGKNTLLVEQLAFLGGTATAALVTPLMHTGIPGNPSPGSIHTRINQRLLEMGQAGRHVNEGWFNPIHLSFILEQMCLEAGVEILYNTFFSDVIMEGEVLKGIIVENKEGRGAIFARRTIDATGDADVACRAGCPFLSGKPDTRVNQPTSLRFEAGGIDTERFSEFMRSLGQEKELDFPYFHTAMVWGGEWPLEPVFKKALQAGDIQKRDGNYFQAFGIPGKPGCLAFNCPEIDPEVDVTRPQYQTRALASGRMAIMRTMRFMKKHFPGFENAFITQAAVMLGVRESRRILGEYLLTARDILAYKKFEDGVSRTNYPVDIHGALEEYADAARPELPESEKYYEVPYRCLVPRKVENLLVAGRCLSADYVAQSSVRIQPTCRGLGEAVGIAAAMSLDQEITPRALDSRKVRQAMKDKGAFL